MRDCGNPEIKHVLPDLLDAADGRAELAEARAHVAGCDSCRAELAFLRHARGSVRTPHVDVSRIVAAIPPYQRAPAWRRLSESPMARVAAAAVLMFGLAVGQQLWTRDVAVRDTLAVNSPASIIPTELPMGTLSDLSEADLESLLDDLGDLEAVTPAEEDVVVLPALEGNGT
jgi:predicted anti-sigma-YlaC factor YlaD